MRDKEEKMRKPLHQCRWIKENYCWQKGKTVRERECTPCMLACVIQSLYSKIKAKKDIMTIEEWRVKERINKGQREARR